MRIAYRGNFQPNVPEPARWSTESQVADTLEAMGHTVIRVQEVGYQGYEPDDWAATERACRDGGAELLLWTCTGNIDPDGGYRVLAKLRKAGIPTAGFHLDLYWGVARAVQILDHPFFRCLPGDTRIRPASVRSVQRRPYAGPLVRIEAGEHHLAATPNHPILSSRGWVAIGDLHEGDYVVSESREQRTGRDAPQVQDADPSIEQVFEAAGKTPSPLAPRSQRVRGMPMDFHGDGSYEQIDVVRAERDLLANFQTVIHEPTGDFAFLLAGAAQVHRSKPIPDLLPVPPLGQPVGLRDTTNMHARVPQDALYDTGPARSEPQGAGDQGGSLARLVTADHLASEKGPPLLALALTTGATGPHMSSDRDEIAMDPAGGASVEVGQLLDRFASLVTLTKVDRVKREIWAGHVYNLTTEEGAYTAEGIITHNCDYVFTADGGHDEGFRRNGINHFWSPPAIFEPDAVIGVPQDEYRPWPLIFVGSYPYPHPEHADARRDIIQWLQSRFGRHFRHYRAGIRGRVLADLYATATVVVGDSCLAGRSPRYWSDRIPETLGRAGFLIHPYVEGLEEHYVDGAHMRTFEPGDLGQLTDLVVHYLSHPDEAGKIARQGREHVLRYHTYRCRMERVLETVGLATASRETADAV